MEIGSVYMQDFGEAGRTGLVSFLNGDGCGQVGNGDGLRRSSPNAQTSPESRHHGIARAHGVEFAPQRQPIDGFDVVAGYVENAGFAPRNHNGPAPLLPQPLRLLHAPVHVGLMGQIEGEQAGQFGGVYFQGRILEGPAHVAHIGHAPHRRELMQQVVELSGPCLGQQRIGKLLVNEQQIELGQGLGQAGQQGIELGVGQVVMGAKIDSVGFLPCPHRLGIHAGIPAAGGCVQVLRIDT